ncbi:Histone H2A type 2-A [Camelus dromedarius]|uniref:Histone H2A type 2-A n=1 Tax=Camelus dromedarius TaxID=9838 RepID=A0A5N4CPG3_CAMDR|nr:Histone H2A type 2-A [Camelus dromedarius]
MSGRGKQGGKEPALEAKSRLHRLLRKGNTRAGEPGAPVYMAAVLEYLTAEILELAATRRETTRDGIILAIAAGYPQRRGAEQAAGQITIAQVVSCQHRRVPPFLSQEDRSHHKAKGSKAGKNPLQSSEYYLPVPPNRFLACRVRVLKLSPYLRGGIWGTTVGGSSILSDFYSSSPPLASALLTGTVPEALDQHLGLIVGGLSRTRTAHPEHPCRLGERQFRGCGTPGLWLKRRFGRDVPPRRRYRSPLGFHRRALRPEWGRGAGNFPLERQGKNDPEVTGVHGAGEQTGDCGSVREPESAEREVRGNTLPSCSQNDSPAGRNKARRLVGRVLPKPMSGSKVGGVTANGQPARGLFNSGPAHGGGKDVPIKSAGPARTRLLLLRPGKQLATSGPQEPPATGGVKSRNRTDRAPWPCGRSGATRTAVPAAGARDRAGLQDGPALPELGGDGRCEASEAYLVGLFEDTNLRVNHHAQRHPAGPPHPRGAGLRSARSAQGSITSKGSFQSHSQLHLEEAVPLVSVLPADLIIREERALEWAKNWGPGIEPSPCLLAALSGRARSPLLSWARPGHPLFASWRRPRAILEERALRTLVGLFRGSCNRAGRWGGGGSDTLRPRRVTRGRSGFAGQSAARYLLTHARKGPTLRGPPAWEGGRPLWLQNTVRGQDRQEREAQIPDTPNGWYPQKATSQGRTGDPAPKQLSNYGEFLRTVTQCSQDPGLVVSWGPSSLKSLTSF